ncbi:bifunctional DNA-formamidopyrimidine glycosylase/DNA-(apurinic or apyrimidinic site) lyase [Methyloceanibacter sp.]|uniref:bifunctional DNA-formamidopyrimidine glycosylase/DNA-(apurinic or apyrimidinic site) lyase n=1 Tax=Methyloceanibacter sp. TaxID=1965321 RepID=UPI002D485EFD|nr:bifunctional DNA-formamidopyrimidine glycosylase/DNA-(apurinic or apyrimidinic site) lyase [Methyloceanibacter sp.]HZP08412.1 bifunctional DNA-formamidopyrimidine glycosylase/DNA-(apurinic or apyrimidinic site) lyase [Methyloceanibacter sp.]
MPELPEVETVRRGLEPILIGNAFARVEQRRKDLRFPLPKRFSERLEGRKIEALDRRAKYLLVRLDDGEVLVMHLGMTGSFSIDHANGVSTSPAREGRQARATAREDGAKHEHIVFHMRDGTAIRYSDARRFGLMDLVQAEKLSSHALFKGLGIEPLSSSFTPEWLAAKLKGKKTSIKAALVDQRLIAGLGNIYACEALFRAGISPKRLAGALATKSGKPTARTEALVESVKAVLKDAIKAGGSSLRDYRRADGSLGEFQHTFNVYGREGKPCAKKGCGGTVRRIVQGGRSTFFCPTCQT